MPGRDTDVYRSSALRLNSSPGALSAKALLLRSSTGSQLKEGRDGIPIPTNSPSIGKQKCPCGKTLRSKMTFCESCWFQKAAAAAALGRMSSGGGGNPRALRSQTRLTTEELAEPSSSRAAATAAFDIGRCAPRTLTEVSPAELASATRGAAGAMNP